MLLRTLFVAFALVTIVWLAPAGGATTDPPFKVTSTLDGQTVLPHRIRWLGFPSLPAAKVASVEFVIDGKMRWTEHTAPYVYAGDDSGRNEGYLVTSWLSPGDHHFAVRVTATGGTVVTDTVTPESFPHPLHQRRLQGSGSGRSTPPTHRNPARQGTRPTRSHRQVATR